MYITPAVTHATQHWAITTPTVRTVERSSRRMVATAATQGVYSSVKVRKLMAEAGVNSAGSAAANSPVPTPSSTPSVLITASLAVNPVISAVATRQSLKPSGRNSGASSRPMMASRLSALSCTGFRWLSKLCRNQMMTVARKITVKAFCRKSRAFSHISISTLRAEGRR